MARSEGKSTVWKKSPILEETHSPAEKTAQGRTTETIYTPWKLLTSILVGFVALVLFFLFCCNELTQKE